jgi:hypothetical protein
LGKILPVRKTLTTKWGGWIGKVLLLRKVHLEKQIRPREEMTLQILKHKLSCFENVTIGFEFPWESRKMLITLKGCANSFCLSVNMSWSSCDWDWISNGPIISLEFNTFWESSLREIG